MLICGAIFPLFGAFYFWFPKFTGRMLSEGIGRWNVALMFIGFHLTFWPMHHLGLSGMTRRIYTYAPGTGWGPMNHLATIGAGELFIAVLLFLINVVRSLRRGLVAGPDPWGAETVEWATDPPPPRYGFHHPPTVRGGSPMWGNLLLIFAETTTVALMMATYFYPRMSESHSGRRRRWTCCRRSTNRCRTWAPRRPTPCSCWGAAR